MKRLLIPLLFLFIPLQTAFATVGGPEYVSNFKYFEEENEIRYLDNRLDGAGCEPEVKSYSLDTNEEKTLLSCEEQFEKMSENLEEMRSEYFVNGVDLQEIDMRKIDIEFNTSYEGVKKGFFEEEEYEEGMEEIYKWEREYIWNIVPIINGKEEGLIKFPICYSRDKINFSGLAVPEKDFMVLVARAISICFEGGYNADTLLFINNVDIPEGGFMGEYREDSEEIATNPYREVGEIEGKILYQLDISAYTDSEDISTEEEVVSRDDITEEDIDDFVEKDNSTAVSIILVIAVVLFIGLSFGRKK